MTLREFILVLLIALFALVIAYQFFVPRDTKVEVQEKQKTVILPSSVEKVSEEEPVLVTEEETKEEIGPATDSTHDSNWSGGVLEVSPENIP